MTADTVAAHERGVGWMVADAPWPTGVEAGISTRTGGCSTAPWNSLNLGDHVGDDPLAVATNRQRLAAHLKAQPVYLQQVHGTRAIPVPHAQAPSAQADACWSHAQGPTCAVMVADCLPIMLAGPGHTGVAAVHAGWRGLAGTQGHGIIESLLAAWPAACTPQARAELTVWLGPCIGPQAFEVGPEVRAAFMATDPAAEQAFVAGRIRDGRPHFFCDLALLARQRLQVLGVHRLYGNDSQPAWCTVTQASRFFSHRRDASRLGASGRMLACITDRRGVETAPTSARNEIQNQ